MEDAKPKRMNRRRALAVGGSVAGGFITATSGVLGGSMTSAAEPAGPSQGLVLNGVTIVDTHDGSLTRDMTIVIDNGKIAKIAPAGSISGRSARAVDAHGTFVVPGFCDFHAHPLSSSDPEGSLTLMLANGITGFREMAGRPDMHEARRQGKLSLPADAPELLELAGEILTPANAGTPDVAVAEVRKQKAYGADFIKVIEYRPDVFNAVAAECKRLNMRFLGHLSPAVNVRDATTAGMRSIEHLGPRDSILLGCSTDEVALRQLMAQTPPAKGPPISGAIPESVIRRALANPALLTDPSEFPRYQRVIATYSEARCRDLAAHFVAAGTWQVPTLIRIRTMEIGDDPDYRNDPNLRYVPKATRDMWEDVSQQFSTKLSASARDTLKQLFALQIQLVKPFKQAGAQMMAGSDSGGGFVIAGFALHQEFDLLEDAGLSPLDVLQMTTLNGAKFLGREARMGSVAEGKDANLVLLSANPIVSIQNLHRITAVVRGGSYQSADALDAMKNTTARRVATGPVAAMAVRPPCC
jgi:hypothetical protein